MNAIIFGPEPPKIGFTQLPSGGITFRVENKRTIHFINSQENITWKDLLPDIELFEWYQSTPGKLDAVFDNLVKEFVGLTGSEIEHKFFDDYVGACRIAVQESIGETSVWNLPALIPQVWVNWIAYDSKDHTRAQRAQREPFRIDFMMKDSEIDKDFIIFEIDGASHFGGYSSEPQVSMMAYTEHLRKDRWLRQQGWQVIRTSNLEVQEYTVFNDFFHELTGKYICMPW